MGVNAEIVFRRARHAKYRTKIYDISPHDCKVVFIDRPKLSELVWVKIDGLETLEAFVCWIEGPTVGLVFQRAINPAVVETLVKRGTGRA